MGVGGRTIAEAKKNISSHEFNIWIAYMRNKGMLVTDKPEHDNKLTEQQKLLLKLNPSTVVK